MINFPEKPVLWFCPVCRKFDLPEVEGSLAFPEHIQHRGVDIGKCEGKMIPLYTKESILSVNEPKQSIKEIIKNINKIATKNENLKDTNPTEVNA